MCRDDDRENRGYQAASCSRSPAPEAVFPQLRELAASDQWQTREVAATALVEIGKRHPSAVLREARQWARADETIMGSIAA